MPRPPLKYSEVLEKIRNAIAAEGLSDAGLMVGNPYSGLKKSHETAREKELR